MLRVNATAFTVQPRGGSLKNHPLAVCRRRRVGNNLLDAKNQEQWSIFLGTEVASSDSPLSPLSSTPLRNYCELLMWPIEALAARWRIDHRGRGAAS